MTELASVANTTKSAGLHPPLAECDRNEQLIELWLHGRSPHTIRAYRQDADYFLAFINGKSLRAVTLKEVQDFSTALQQQDSAGNTVKRKLSAVKSLLTFGHRIGVLPVNAGAPVRVPKVKDTLAERILTEAQVMGAIALEPSVRNHKRNQIMLQFLYATGCRVSELAALKWQDVRSSKDDTGQVTIFGKGGKTRVVRFSATVWQQLRELKGEAGPDDALFVSRKGGHLRERQIARIVKAAGMKAEAPDGVSPHWFRHSHGTHAMNRGAKGHVVQYTLGHSSLAVTGMYLHAMPQESSGLSLGV